MACKFFRRKQQFRIENGVLRSYNGSERELVIPQGVTEIIGFVFEGNQALRRVVIPEGVKRIGICAFRACTKLEEVVLPSTLEAIDEKAFSACISLEKADLPERLRSLAYDAFEYTQLALTQEKEDRSDPVLYVGKTAMGFKGVHVKHLVIKDGTTRIGDQAFFDTEIEELTLPESIEYIGLGAFNNCTKLRTIHIPDKAVCIMPMAFASTAWIRSQPNGVLYLGAVALGYKGFLELDTDLVIRPGTKYIADEGFQLPRLYSIRLPEGLEVIGESAFRYSGLTVFNIPESVRCIGAHSFDWCVWWKRQPYGNLYQLNRYLGIKPKNTEPDTGMPAGTFDNML